MSATPIILPAPGAQDQDAAPETNGKTVESETSDEASSTVAAEKDSAVSIDASAALLAAKPFAGLADIIIEAIAEKTTRRDYASGQTVFSMGQYDGAEAFVVARGRMRVSVVDPETGAMMVDDIAENGCFAIDLTFGGEENDLFQRLAVTAEEDLTLLFLDADTLRTLAGQRPSLMRNLAAYFAEELSERRFSALSAEAAPQQRVFTELLKFVERDGVSGFWRVPRMPKHRELADLADVDENVAAAAVATLIQEGVAQRDYPGLIVNDMSRLNDLAG